MGSRADPSSTEQGSSVSCVPATLKKSLSPCSGRLRFLLKSQEHKSAEQINCKKLRFACKAQSCCSGTPCPVLSSGARRAGGDEDVPPSRPAAPLCPHGPWLLPPPVIPNSCDSLHLSFSLERSMNAHAITHRLSVAIFIMKLHWNKYIPAPNSAVILSPTHLSVFLGVSFPSSEHCLAGGAAGSCAPGTSREGRAGGCDAGWASSPSHHQLSSCERSLHPSMGRGMWVRGG